MIQEAETSCFRIKAVRETQRRLGCCLPYIKRNKHMWLYSLSSMDFTTKLLWAPPLEYTDVAELFIIQLMTIPCQQESFPQKPSYRNISKKMHFQAPFPLEWKYCQHIWNHKCMRKKDAVMKPSRGAILHNSSPGLCTYNSNRRKFLYKTGMQENPYYWKDTFEVLWAITLIHNINAYIISYFAVVCVVKDAEITYSNIHDF